MKRPPIRPEDVLCLTDLGKAQLQGSGTKLDKEQLELLIHIDGIATAESIASRLPAAEPQHVQLMLEKLRDAGMLVPGRAAVSDSLDFTGFFSVKPDPTGTAASAVAEEAAAGASSLRQHGYYVRIARAAAGPRAQKPDARLTVLVVEDEPHLGKLLKTYFSLEGFEARIAANRAEILAELRRPPLPDLVLIDVMLPDVNGFDILAAIRKHPALGGVRTIMLTAKATREAVLMGLAGGADGYITKPFEVDVLMKAVQSVLGLPLKA